MKSAQISEAGKLWTSWSSLELLRKGGGRGAQCQWQEQSGSCPAVGRKPGFLTATCRGLRE